MSDCANVEMRELLPELAAGTLDASTRARVEAHLRTCDDCASELETLRLVRAAFSGGPVIDTRRIVAALPKPAAHGRAVAAAAPVKRWLDWRIAAALTTITLGGLSLAVSQRLRPSTPLATDDSVQIALKPADAPNADPIVVPRGTAMPRDSQTPQAAVRAAGQLPAAAAKPQLSFGGGMADLDDASMAALLGALDEIDRAPVAPSAEPDPTPVLPVIRSGER